MGCGFFVSHSYERESLVNVGNVLPSKRDNLQLSLWEHGSFSVFVDSLPGSVSKIWPHQIFGKFGKITNIVISRKARRFSSSPFAFVRFRSKEEDLKACQELHGTKLEDLNMVVSEARVKR